MYVFICTYQLPCRKNPRFSDPLDYPNNPSSLLNRIIEDIYFNSSVRNLKIDNHNDRFQVSTITPIYVYCMVDNVQYLYVSNTWYEDTKKCVQRIYTIPEIKCNNDKI